MSLVDWLKGLTERPSGAGGETTPAKPRRPAKARPAHKGEAYAKEWVKVLEESEPGRDAYNTYTWELKPDATGAATSAPANADPESKPAKPAGNEPYDTYTWELQEGNTAEDPWGLKKDPQKSKQPDGVNPYDTGVFDASWTGRFDQR
jgi:hypothetical protein